MTNNVVACGWLFTLPQATFRQKYFCEVSNNTSQPNSMAMTNKTDKRNLRERTN